MGGSGQAGYGAWGKQGGGRAEYRWSQAQPTTAVCGSWGGRWVRLHAPLSMWMTAALVCVPACAAVDGVFEEGGEEEETDELVGQVRLG